MGFASHGDGYVELAWIDAMGTVQWQRFDLGSLNPVRPPMTARPWRGTVALTALEDGGVGAVGDPAIATWSSDRTDVIARMSDGTLRHQVRLGDTWQPEWLPVGLDPFRLAPPSPYQSLIASPAVAAWGDGRVDVFIRDENYRLLHLPYAEGAWPNNTVGVLKGPDQYIDTMGHALWADPGAVSWGLERLDVFAYNDQRELFHAWSDDGLHWGTEIIPGILNHGSSPNFVPRVFSWYPGRLDLIVAGVVPGPGNGLGVWWTWYDNGDWDREPDGSHRWIAWPLGFDPAVAPARGWILQGPDLYPAGTLIGDFPGYLVNGEARYDWDQWRNERE
jgi:hypothetical protein